MVYFSRIYVNGKNGQKKIQVFINLDSKKLFDDFWNYMDQQR